MAKDDNYRDMMLEDMNGKIDTILEIVVPMQQDVTQLKQDMVEVKSDIRVIKALLKDTIDEVKAHDRRITRLETKAA